METHLVLLEIAGEDLKAASCLLEKKLYRHSVFFLQQSIEKLLKSLGIWTNIISINQARDDIGHIGHLIVVKFLENFSKREIPDATISALEKMGIEREYVGRLKLGAEKGRALLSKYPTRQALKSSLFSRNLLLGVLDDIQRELQEMRRFRVDLQEQLERLDEKEVEEFRKDLPQFVDNMFPGEIAEAIRKVLRQVPPDMMVAATWDVLRESLVNFAIPRCELDFCWLSLFQLSLLFSAHEAAARYPMPDFNPLEVYTENAPLIQVFNPFIEIISEIYTLLADVYTKMKPLDFS
nr:HEPN domain-containing protein [Candidatus Njordarchaeota archaeon]